MKGGAEKEVEVCDTKLTKQSDHAIACSSNQEATVVVECHAVDRDGIGCQREGAL